MQVFAICRVSINMLAPAGIAEKPFLSTHRSTLFSKLLFSTLIFFLHGL
jgi:hypothetical protein